MAAASDHAEINNRQNLTDILFQKLNFGGIKRYFLGGKLTRPTDLLKVKITRPKVQITRARRSDVWFCRTLQNCKYYIGPEYT